MAIYSCIVYLYASEKVSVHALGRKGSAPSARQRKAILKAQTI